MSFKTPITELFGIKHPILLAGMNVAAGPDLAAAVTNAGGLGVIGGVGYTPKFLRSQIKLLKSNLINKNSPFGVDLLLPKVGEGARKTNHDYTNGTLPELIDIIIEEKASLFVSAVGVPPKWVVDKLHQAGIPVMNMIGSPRHVEKCIDAGVDILCAQGGEGGGHTGDVSTMILIPKIVDLVRGRKSYFTQKQISVVAAGGIYDGRGLAAALSLGADAVWVGTRFVCAKEAGAPKEHQNSILKATVHDTIRSTIYTGRPMRVIKTKYNSDWQERRYNEMQELQNKGVKPFEYDMNSIEKKSGEDEAYNFLNEHRPWLTGQVAGVIEDVKPAKEIIDDMISGAAEQLKRINTLAYHGSNL